MKKYRIELTELELKALQTVISQGWGDGDHEELLRDATNKDNPDKHVAALHRAMDKVDNAKSVGSCK